MTQNITLECKAYSPGAVLNIRHILANVQITVFQRTEQFQVNRKLLMTVLLPNTSFFKFEMHPFWSVSSSPGNTERTRYSY